MEGGWRIVILREAERMNEQAQNAFLKTLETYGRAITNDTSVILTTDSDLFKYLKRLDPKAAE